MFNQVIIIGRLARDPETKQIQSGTTLTKITIGCERDAKAEDGTRPIDWFDATAFGKTAEVIAQYFTKGSPIQIVGRLQTRSWKDNDGKNRKSTDILISNVSFLPKAKDSSAQFTDLGDDEGGDLPF